MSLNFRAATTEDRERAVKLQHQTRNWSRDTLVLNLAILLTDYLRLQSVIASQRKRLAEQQEKSAEPKPSKGTLMLRRAGIIP